MRRGTKRKAASQKAEADKHKESSKAIRTTRTTKRVKASEPQYLEDPRNLQDLWKAAFPVGTEWDQLDSLYQFNRDFSNLEQAFEEGGSSTTSTPTMSTSLAALSLNWSPSMAKTKLIAYWWWSRDSQVDRFKSQIFILACTQRRTALKHMKIERLKKFEYCLPYFYQLFKEDEFEQSTEVPIMFPGEPKPVYCEFDWELDELEEFVKEKVREQRKSNREAREARRKAIEEMSEEAKAAFENMRLYKFYPVHTPDTTDMSNVKAPFINRYYGKAREVL